MKIKLPMILTIIFLAGCAGSATHEITSLHVVGDSTASCDLLDSKIEKTQEIIDGVNKDRLDITGPDVIDGILWFPLNLIAKYDNYQNAIKAASDRIGNLQALKKEHNCE